MRLRSFFQYGIATFSFFFLLGWGVSFADCFSDCRDNWWDQDTCWDICSTRDENGEIDAGSSDCWLYLDDDAQKKCRLDDCLSKCVTFKDGSKWEACECKCYGGVPLNTNVPFVWKCIQMNEEGEQAWNDPNTAVVTPTSAFPILMKGLSRVALSLFLALSFVMVIASGVIIATSGANSSGMSQWTTLLKRVVMSFVLLWTIGVILCLINPFFFCPQLF